MGSLNVSVGGITLPVSAESVATTQVFPDPGKPALLALLAQAITSELAEAWPIVVLNTPLIGRAVVQDTYAEKPTESLLKQRVSKVPALYLHRLGKPRFERWTFSARRIRQTWMLYYILGELDAAAQHKLSAVMMPGVPVIVAETLERGRHPDYLTGISIIGDTVDSGISRAEYQEADRVEIASDGAAALHGVAVQFETLERVTRNVTFVPFEGAQIGLDLVAGGAAEGDADLEDFLEMDTT